MSFGIFSNDPHKYRKPAAEARESVSWSDKRVALLYGLASKKRNVWFKSAKSRILVMPWPERIRNWRG